MNKKIILWSFLLILFAGILLSGEYTVNAQTHSYQLIRSVISSGGAKASASSFTLTNTLAQPIIGASSSGDFQIGSGFWTQLLNQITDFLFIYLPLLLR